MKVFIVIFLSVFLVTACAAKPGPNLASKASLVHKGLTTKNEVLGLLGPPVQAFLMPDGKEEWYYYYRVMNFWENFPVVRGYKGEDYTEVLKLIFHGEVLQDVFYYTVENPLKKSK
ncbi:MAG: hypothetical protein N2Z40_03430 [Caldimicrobium sp.]|nr:hypothetical protein [Caldimicrobium sp.]MCX7613260.1 hypothetical protein [Caldimicrobium sp.]MDW8182057.1 hypothetical protein [Caldimicrobium sp.]